MAEDTKRLKQTNEGRLGLAGHRRVDRVLDVEEGTTVEDVLKPEYWAHVAHLFNTYDHIEAREETGLWVLDLMVIWAERGTAIVKLLHKYDLPSASEAVGSGSSYEVQWKGPHHKHAVIRKADGVMVGSKYGTRESAAAAASALERN